MVLCDSCNRGYHCDCINLEDVPKEDWYCKECFDLIEEKLDSNLFVDPIQDFDLLDFLKGKHELEVF